MCKAMTLKGTTWEHDDYNETCWSSIHLCETLIDYVTDRVSERIRMTRTIGNVILDHIIQWRTWLAILPSILLAQQKLRHVRKVKHVLEVSFNPRMKVDPRKILDLSLCLRILTNLRSAYKTLLLNWQRKFHSNLIPRWEKTLFWAQSQKRHVVR